MSLLVQWINASVLKGFFPNALRSQFVQSKNQLFCPIEEAN